MMLHRLMGRKSFGFVSDFVLGMRVMNVWFMFGGMIPEFNTDKVAFITSDPTIFQ